MTHSNPPDDDPFAEFEDWLVDGPAGRWPHWPHEKISEVQKKVVASNADLLIDQAAWYDKVKRFEAALAALDDDLAIKAKRTRYEIRFDRHTFSDGFKNFTGYKFPGSISFSDTEFGDGDVSFAYAIFADGDVSFVGASFGDGDVSFELASFGDGDAHFRYTTFGRGELSFSEAAFGTGDVSFCGSRFGDGDVYFAHVSFGSGDVSFSKVQFGHGEALFHGAHFGQGQTSFDRAWLKSSRLSFESASFGSVFDIGHAIFEEGVIQFSWANMGDCEVVLNDVDMSKSSLEFGSLTLGGRLLCRNLSVGRAYFSSTAVMDLADWTDAVFRTIPDFRHMKLDRAPEVARMWVPKPTMVHIIGEKQQEKRRLSKRDFWQLVAADGDDVLKLRKLKAMAIAANDHEKDGEFFAYEMMAKRGVEHTTFWQLFFNTIYWKVSFYGQSYLRPLGWLAGSFATFAAIYSLMAALPIGGWQSLAFGITYSFKNSLPFLGTLTRSVPSPEGHVSWFALQLQAIKDAQPGPDWFTILGTGQAMLSLFFFFFVLLGLRNKFRLK